ncbi:hypothetical protein [Lysobacter sp. CA199]|uniref:hypothetical protein n=1 Tax=Lysobacter sp. CA199 TaxID=3455608 RepID=UPI003F8D31D4
MNVMKAGLAFALFGFCAPASAICIATTCWAVTFTPTQCSVAPMPKGGHWMRIQARAIAARPVACSLAEKIVAPKAGDKAALQSATHFYYGSYGSKETCAAFPREPITLMKIDRCNDVIIANEPPVPIPDAPELVDLPPQAQ